MNQSPYKAPEKEPKPSFTPIIVVGMALLIVAYMAMVFYKFAAQESPPNRSPFFRESEETKP